MKELNTKLIIEHIASSLLALLCLIVCVLLDSIILGILLFVSTFLLFNYIFSKIKKYKENKKLEKFHTKIKELKIKENKTLMEVLYLNAYNDFAVDILVKILKKNEIKHIYDMDFDIDEETLNSCFSFKYKSYNISNEIYVDKIISKMDFEKDQELLININDYKNLEEYFNEILPMINRIISIIETKTENNISNKTINQILEYADFNISQHKITLLLSIITTPIFGILGYFGMKELIPVLNENFLNFIIGSIIVLSLPLLIVFAYIYSICGLIENIKLKKDVANNNISEISGKPYKVKFIFSTVGVKYPRVLNFGSGFILYFNTNTKKKLKYITYFSSPTRIQKKEVKKEIMKKQFEINYYTNSNYICNELKDIKKIIKRKLR